MSNSELRTQISDLAPEILSQIFVHCLPSNPLRHRQSEGKVAPVLLCHVCSYWRAIALDTVDLWIHLNHFMRTFTMIKPYWLFEISTHIEFLRWWMKNLRGRSPVLRLQAEASHKRDPRGILTQKGRHVVLNLLSSAHYIDMTKECAEALRSIGKAVLDQPIVDTLILRKEKTPDSRGSDLHFTLRNIPLEPHPIRRLYLNALFFYPANFPSMMWSHLTHAVLAIPLTKQAWFELIRGCVCLQFGRFSLEIHKDRRSRFDPPFRVPPKKTLPQLRQLVMSLSYCPPDVGNGPDHIFKDLNLPALSAFRLECLSGNITQETLLSTLASTPLLTELHLGFNIPTASGSMGRSIFDPIIEPLPTQIPLLERLVLRLTDEEFKDFDLWLCSLMTSKWLELGKSSNCIEQVEFTLDPTQPLDYDHKLEICGVLRDRTLDRVEFTLTEQETSPWVGQFDFLEDDVDHCFEKMMFKEVL